MSLTAKLSIDNSEFKKGLKDAENQAKNSMNKMSKATNDANSSLSKMTTTLNNVSSVSKGGLGGVTSVLAKMGPYGAAAAAGIGLIGVAITSILKGVSTLAHGLRDTVKTANSVNMSANAYISLQHACAKAGIEMSKVLMLINKIDYAVIHAEAGEKKYADAFYKLGIAWEDLEKMSPEKRLMAVNDAMRELKESGKAIPKEMFDIFGKRDMQTLNKMQQQKDFNKLIAEAGALGYTIPDSMLQAAVRYAEVTDGTAARFKAMIASMKMMEDLTNGLSDLWTNISNRIISATGNVDKAYKDDFEGIGDVGKRLLTSETNRLSDRNKKDILKAMYETGIEFVDTKANKKVSAEYGQNMLSFIESLSGDDLTKEFEAQIKEIDWNSIGDTFRHSLFKVVESVDSRFKENDRKTWVQAKEQRPEDKAAKTRRLEESHANYEARSLNEQLKRNQQYYDNALSKNKKIIDVDKEILKIEQNLQLVLGDKNAKLDEEIKHQLRLNAALVNQKALQSEINKITELRQKNYTSFYSTMLGGMGADKNILDQLFSGLKTLNDGKLDLMKGKLLPSLMSEFFKLENPREANESNAAYNKRIQDLVKNSRSSYDSAAEFFILRPDKFWKAFQNMADKFAENEIDIVFDDEELNTLKQAEAEYNKFADKVKADPISINLDFESNADDRNTKNYAEIKDALEGFKNQEIKDSQESSWISQARAKRARLQAELDTANNDENSIDRNRIQDEVDDIDAQIKKLEIKAEQLKTKLNSYNDESDDGEKVQNEINVTNDLIKKLETRRAQLKTKLNASGDDVVSESKIKAKAEFDALDAQIKKYEASRNKLEELLNKAQNLLGKAKFTDEIKKANEEAYNQEVLSNMFKFRTSKEDTEREIKLIEAQTKKEQEAEDEIQKQNILKKAGIVLTERNLKNYDDILDDLIKINKQLDEAKNKKTLTEKIEASTDNNKLSKNILKQNWNEVERLEKINHLRAIGVRITKENIDKYDELLKKLQAQDAEQRRLNMLSQLKTGANSLKYSILEFQGKGKEANRQKALDDAEKTLQRRYTTAEKNLIVSLADLQYKMAHWKMPEQKDSIIHTNDLAKRGGFNSSVIVERNDVSKQQLKVAQNMQSLLNESNSIQKRIEKVLK